MQLQYLINRYTISSLFSLVIIFLIYKYANRQSKINTTKECFVAAQRKISGVVQNAYFDNDINVKAFVILFTTGEKYVNPFFLKSLNGYIAEGDSINKASGAFKFEIYKKNNSLPVIFIDTVDCDKLK